METIVSACISAGITLIVCLINNNSQNSKTRNLMEYKIDELTERVNKHNNLIERTYHLEDEAHLIEHELKVVNNRIKDLEESQSK